MTYFLICLSAMSSIKASNFPVLQVATPELDISSPDLRIAISPQQGSNRKMVKLAITIANANPFSSISFNTSDIDSGKVKISFTDAQGRSIPCENDFIVDDSSLSQRSPVATNSRLILKSHCFYGYYDTFDFRQPLITAYATGEATLTVFRETGISQEVKLKSGKVKVWPTK